MTESTTTVACSQCGAQHELGEIEVAFGLPDDYFRLSEDERAARGQASTDFCRLDARYFIRSVIPVPLLDGGREVYCWGVWIEVSKADFQLAQDTWSDADVSHLARLSGRLANRLPEYPQDGDVHGELELRADRRPFFYVHSESGLRNDQTKGISSEDALRYYHAIA